MPLTKLQFRSGVNQEIASYSNEVDGATATSSLPLTTEKLGGWEKYLTAPILVPPVRCTTGLHLMARTISVLAHT